MKTSTKCIWDLWKYCLQYVLVKHSNCLRRNVSKKFGKRIQHKKNYRLRSVCILTSSHKTLWRLQDVLKPLGKTTSNASITPSNCWRWNFWTRQEIVFRIEKTFDFKLCDLKTFTWCVCDFLEMLHSKRLYNALNWLKSKCLIGVQKTSSSLKNACLQNVFTSTSSHKIWSHLQCVFMIGQLNASKTSVWRLKISNVLKTSSTDLWNIWNFNFTHSIKYWIRLEHGFKHAVIQRTSRRLVRVHDGSCFVNNAYESDDKFNGGFCKGHRTANNMFILHDLILGQLILGKQIYLCMVEDIYPGK